MAIIGLMAAVICIIAPISLVLPISPVPISLGTFSIFFAIYVLGMKRGTASLALYILLGLVGLPVFSGFTGGVGKLLGPTGGYILGYLFLAVISGYIVDRWRSNRIFCFVGFALGTLFCYMFGTIWLAFQASISFSQALAAAVLPFIPGDLIKLILAMLLGAQVRKRLAKANLA